MKKPELLAPAGDFERLRMAVAYGADAVYLGVDKFSLRSMRSAPGSFSAENLPIAVRTAHENGVRVYLTANTVPSNEQIDTLPAFFSAAADAGVDAFIISDMGVLTYARKYAPSVAVHISTQAGVTNYAAANALFSLGARRVVLARELSLKEIARIRESTPSGLEIEAFVHGAMCVSFSGRCLLSNYLTARDANRGECAQPCRWKYTLMQQERPGRFMPVFEDSGTYIMNSKDLCMISHIPELVEAGVTSFKIEGRAKSEYYAAAVTNAYRLAIDSCFGGKNIDVDTLEREVEKVSHREYCTGFFFGPIQNGQVYADSSYRRGWDICAVASAQENSRGLDACEFRLKSRLSRGDEAELLEPGSLPVKVIVREIYDTDGRSIQTAEVPESRILVRLPFVPKPYSILRKRTENTFQNSQKVVY